MSRRVEITGIHPYPQTNWWAVAYRVTTNTHVTETEIQVKAVDELEAARWFMQTKIWKSANE